MFYNDLKVFSKAYDFCFEVGSSETHSVMPNSVPLSMQEHYTSSHQLCVSYKKKSNFENVLTF